MMKPFLFYLSLIAFVISSPGYAEAQSDACVKYKPVRIVVLGSSTAAGSGPSTRDSAWVWRYRAYMQNINPDNEVINLAQGGYVTYRLMPDNHVPPTGRPAPDTMRNITHALSLDPDAIIVNLPSNDRQWPAADQLANFDSLYRTSMRAGVPIWICTTQPITSAGAYQAEVRDSIFARYGNRALDFWNGIVAPNSNLVDSIYAADAVHLNDLGHRVLVNVVIDAKIPEAIFQAAPSPDLALASLELPEQGACISQFLTGRSIIINLGQPLGPGWGHMVNIGGAMHSQIIQDSLRTCEIDTLDWSYTIQPPGQFTVIAEAVAAADTTTDNNQQTADRYYDTPPALSTTDTAICGSGDITLAVNSDADTVFWYDSPVSTTPVGGGETLFLSNVQQNLTRYAQAVRGPLVYENQLSAATAANVDWNGVMFDLIAHDSLVIDSLEMYISDAGRHEVTAMYRLGSHVPEAQNPAAWTLWGTDSVTFVDPSDPVYVDFGQMSISSGDTVGVYLYLTESGRRLRYERGTNNTSFQESVLELYAGTGVSHTFGDLYNPRHWQGKVFFHHGNRLEGDCATPRIPVQVRVDTALPDAGYQYIIQSLQVDFIANDRTASSYFWSFGDGTTATGDSVRHVYTNGGLVNTWLAVSNGCGLDTVFQDIGIITPGIENELSLITIFPNPTTDGIWRMELGEIPLRGWTLTDVIGRKYHCDIHAEGNGIYRIEASLTAGVYVLNMQGLKPVKLVIE